MNTVKFQNVVYDGKGELRATNNGNKVAVFQVQDKKVFKSGKSYTNYFDCEAWGELGGKLVLMPPCVLEVEAEAKMDSFTTKKGEKRRVIRFTARSIEQAGEVSETCQTSHRGAENANTGEQPYYDDDIPF